VAAWAIRRSAELCSVRDYEIVIVHNGPDDPPQTGPHVRVVIDDWAMPVFNRSRLINLGIAAAGRIACPHRIDRSMQERWPLGLKTTLRPDRKATSEDVLTVLDADAIVGPRWFEGARQLRDANLIRICYRVRWLTPAEQRALVTAWPPPPGLLDRLFASADLFPSIPDTFGSGELAVLPDSATGRIYGNSQLSICRGALGDLRFDETFVGWGSEDLDFNRRLVTRHGPDYRAMLDVRGNRSICFLPHRYDLEWRNDAQASANHARYLAGASEVPGSV
jgi:hypothetical protein